jgi:para-nitrobenzyl esterase
MRCLIGLALAVSFLATAALSTNPYRVISIAASEDPLVVTTKTGNVRGVVRPSGGAEFLGIPYAQPPVGDLRWREPLLVKDWSGVRDAKLFGAPCAQATLGEWNKHDAE